MNAITVPALETEYICARFCLETNGIELKLQHKVHNSLNLWSITLFGSLTIRSLNYSPFEMNLR